MKEVQCDTQKPQTDDRLHNKPTSAAPADLAKVDMADAPAGTGSFMHLKLKELNKRQRRKIKELNKTFAEKYALSGGDACPAANV